MKRKKRLERNSNSKTLRISTTGGVIFANSKEEFHIYVGNAFIPTNNIREGDKLDFVRGGINPQGGVSLDDVHLTLMEQFEVYRNAHDKLHTIYNGREIPLFQELFVKAVAKFSSDSDLETKLLSGKDLFKEDRRTALEWARELVRDFNRDGEYADSTLYGWLKGEVLAPAEWGVFETLAKEYSDFNVFRDEGDDSLQRHLRKYLNRRAGVMAHIASREPGKESLVKVKKTYPNEHDSIHQELEFVYNKYADFLRTGHMTVTVEKVEIVKSNGDKRQISEKPILSRGVRKKVNPDERKMLDENKRTIALFCLCDELVAAFHYPFMDSVNLNVGIIMDVVSYALQKRTGQPFFRIQMESDVLTYLFNPQNRFNLFGDLSEKVSPFEIVNALMPSSLIGSHQALVLDSQKRVILKYLKEKGSLLGFNLNKTNINESSFKELERSCINRSNGNYFQYIFNAYKTGVIEDKLRIPRGNLDKVIDLAGRLFASLPHEARLWCVGGAFYDYVKERVALRSLVNLLDTDDPYTITNNYFGIPLLKNINVRTAYLFDSGSDLIDYKKFVEGL